MRTRSVRGSPRGRHRVRCPAEVASEGHLPPSPLPAARGPGLPGLRQMRPCSACLSSGPGHVAPFLPPPPSAAPSLPASPRQPLKSLVLSPEVCLPPPVIPWWISPLFGRPGPGIRAGPETEPASQLLQRSRRSRGAAGGTPLCVFGNLVVAPGFGGEEVRALLPDSQSRQRSRLVAWSKLAWASPRSPWPHTFPGPESVPGLPAAQVPWETEVRGTQTQGSLSPLCPSEAVALSGALDCGGSGRVGGQWGAAGGLLCASGLWSPAVPKDNCGQRSWEDGRRPCDYLMINCTLGGKDGTEGVSRLESWSWTSRVSLAVRRCSRPALNCLPMFSTTFLWDLEQSWGPLLGPPGEEHCPVQLLPVLSPTTPAALFSVCFPAWQSWQAGGEAAQPRWGVGVEQPGWRPLPRPARDKCARNPHQW